MIPQKEADRSKGEQEDDTAGVSTDVTGHSASLEVQVCWRRC